MNIVGRNSARKQGEWCGALVVVLVICVVTVMVKDRIEEGEKEKNGKRKINMFIQLKKIPNRIFLNRKL